jgi:hypothetical protein
MGHETTTEAAAPFRSVGRRFSLALIGIVPLLLIGFAILAIAINIRNLQTELETKLHNALNLATVSLKTPLWNVDRDTVDDFIESLFLDRAIVHARVLAEGQAMVTKAQEAVQYQGFDDLAQSSPFLADAAEITYEDTTVGTIQLVVSRASIRQQIVLNIAGIVALTILVIVAIAITSVLVSRWPRAAVRGGARALVRAGRGDQGGGGSGCAAAYRDTAGLRRYYPGGHQTTVKRAIGHHTGSEPVSFKGKVELGDKRSIRWHAYSASSLSGKDLAVNI